MVILQPYSPIVLRVCLWWMCVSWGSGQKNKQNFKPLLQIKKTKAWVRESGVLVSVTVSYLKCRRCRESFCGPWLCWGRSGRSWSGKTVTWCLEETEPPTFLASLHTTSNLGTNLLYWQEWLRKDSWECIWSPSCCICSRYFRSAQPALLEKLRVDRRVNYS